MTRAFVLLALLLIARSEALLSASTRVKSPIVSTTAWDDSCRVGSNYNLVASKYIKKGEVLSLCHERSDMIQRNEQIPGWLGHYAVLSASSHNCIEVPLPSPPASPSVSALVATCDIPKGALVRRSSHVVGSSSDTQLLLERHSRDLQLAVRRFALQTVKFQYPFHEINLEYPGLEQIHEGPDVFVIRNFLTDIECDRIMAKAEPCLHPCLVKDTETGQVKQDTTRTSFNANIPRREVPTVVSKLKHVLRCSDENRLEILQVLRYSEGQQFVPHTDGYNGPATACGFENSARLVTIFCYLNSVDEGGHTAFNELGLEIAPEKGTAVIHFPTTLGFEEDKRTRHQGCPAVDDKWLLVTWLWKDPLSDSRYAEYNLSACSNDVI